jgi:hypothetical protein
MELWEDTLVVDHEILASKRKSENHPGSKPQPFARRVELSLSSLRARGA